MCPDHAHAFVPLFDVLDEAWGQGLHQDAAILIVLDLQVRKVDSVEVANYLMERMGKDSATAELIHPDELVAGVISQVAAEPDMGELLAAFVYSSAGRRCLRHQSSIS